MYEIRLAKLNRRSKLASKARTRETVLSASNLTSVGNQSGLERRRRTILDQVFELQKSWI